jgi:uncharacterized protein (DUF433 family)
MPVEVGARGREVDVEEVVQPAVQPPRRHEIRPAHGAPTAQTHARRQEHTRRARCSEATRGPASPRRSSSGRSGTPSPLSARAASLRWRLATGSPRDSSRRCDTGRMSVDVLQREMFSEAEAARLLRVAQSTLHYWLEGGDRRGKTYEPVIRVEPRGARSVTWAEFIEAGLLRQYRRQHNVPMAELRAFIDVMRERYSIPYPLAHERPFVADRQLLREAQDLSGLAAEYCLVAEARGQLLLTPPAESFVQRVEWSDDIAVAWRPHDDPRSPVRMDPRLRFGRPSIKGISTEILGEHIDAGEDLDETADSFGLAVDDVRWALAYETSLRSAA